MLSLVLAASLLDSDPGAYALRVASHRAELIAYVEAKRAFDVRGALEEELGRLCYGVDSKRK